MLADRASRSSLSPAGTHLEVEAVLDTDPGFELPELAGTGGITAVADGGVQHLDATYFDTADLVLIRSGVTLRRRTGGEDGGWHLKLPRAVPGGVGSSGSLGKARLEVHRPLGTAASTPPAALLALVQVWLRGRPVQPVARLRTTRRVNLLLDQDGCRLAELADDQVAAESYRNGEVTASSWREVEVELADPAAGEVLPPVVAALRAAGARPAVTSSKLARALALRQNESVRPGRPSAGPAKRKHPATASEAVLAYLAEQLAALVRCDPQVRLDSPDAVHQMRVACRRVRSALAAFRPLFGADDARRLSAEVAWVGAALGDARDAEVMRAHLLAEVERQPSELMVGPVAQRIDHELSRTYREAHAAAVRMLDSQRYSDVLGRLEAFVLDPPPVDPAADDETPAGRASLEELTRLVRRAHRRVRRAAHAADAAADPMVRDALLHEVRKAAKRARYAAEVARDSLPKVRRGPAKSYAGAAKAVQGGLGDHHDAVVLREQLLLLAARAERAGESAFGYGVMHADLGHRRALDDDQFTRSWHHLQAVAHEWPG